MPRRIHHLHADELSDLCGAVVVRVSELERHGIGRRTTAYRCRPGGQWRRMLPGVVLLNNGAPTRNDRRQAALVYAGAGAVITSLDALELHGMRRAPAPSGPVHLLIPADRRRVGAGRVLCERTDRLPEIEPGRWPLAPLPRAVLDFARRCGDRNEVRAALAETVQRGRCAPAELAAELAAGSQRGSALPRAVLYEISDGVRSVAEAKARELIQRSGLPRPIWNPRLVDAVTGRFIAMPDAWFDQVGLAWEIDSYEWHLSPDDYDATLARRAALMAAGVTVVHHQPSRVTSQAAAVVDELRRTYAQAALRPRPVVRVDTPQIPTNGTFGQ